MMETSEAQLESAAREFTERYIKDLEMQLGPLPELLASTLRASCPYMFTRGAAFIQRNYDCLPKT